MEPNPTRTSTDHLTQTSPTYPTQMPVPTRQITEEDMKRYFKEVTFPKAVIWLIGIGILLFLCGAVIHGAGAVLAVGLLFLLIGGGVIAFRVQAAQSSITDQQYDQWVENQASMMLNRAYQKLGLMDPSQIIGEPLRIRGRILASGGRFSPDEVRWKKGKDGIYRFSVNTYTFFFPTEHHLAAFSGAVSALNWTAHNEVTEEYFYKHIVGATVSDEQNYITIKEKRINYRFQRFSLKITSGNSINVEVSATPLDNKSGSAPSFDSSDSGLDQTVSTLRMLLRQKNE